MPVNGLQSNLLDGTLKFPFEGIEEIPETKAKHEGTTLQAARLHRNRALAAFKFLSERSLAASRNEKITSHQKEVFEEWNIWAEVGFVSMIFDQPSPQDSFGLTAPGRDDPNSPITKKDVIDYVNTKITERIESLQKDGAIPARLLTAAQIKGLDLGLTEEQIQVLNFGENTLRVIEILQQQNPNLSPSAALEQIQALDKQQVAGILEFRLTLEQIQDSNFGLHTIEYMKFLQKQSPSLSVEEIFGSVQGQDEAQIIALFQAQLTEEQKQAHHLGLHTLVSINQQRQKDPDLLFEQAFAQIQGLNKEQIEGLRLGLTREQVETLHFGQHTLAFLEQRAVNVPLEGAFAQVQGLTAEQIAILLQLTEDQREDENFGPHIVVAIEFLQSNIPNLSTSDALRQVRVLNAHQVQILLQLTKEQVQAPNFESHTIQYMDFLQRQNPSLSIEEAFDRARGLSETETVGMSSFGLTLEEVQAPNFGEDTLEAIRALRELDQNLSLRDAFEQVRRLNHPQIQGLTRYDLTIEQVQHPNFREGALTAIDSLQDHDPNLLSRDAFEQVRDLNDVQLDGLRLELTLDQVTTGNIDQFTIRTLEFLIGSPHDLPAQEAFGLTQTLSKLQIEGLKSGLTLDQVQAPDFGPHMIPPQVQRVTLSIPPHLLNAAMFVSRHAGLSLVDAAKQVRGLTAGQVNILIRLTPEQVQSPNFGPHTIQYMEILQNQKPNLSINEAFEQVRGLTKTQIFLSILSPQQREKFHVGEHTERGIDFLQALIPTLSSQAAFNLVLGLTAGQVNILIRLTPEQVQTSNFGPHTVIGIEFLQQQNPTLSIQGASSLVQTLNAHQVQTLLQLTSEQVQAPNFGPHTIGRIRVLQTQNPGLSLAEAFEQVRGLTKIQVFLSPLSSQQREEFNVGKHTERGIEFLQGQIADLSLQNAFNLVRGLTEKQVNILIRLTPEQIQARNFGSYTIQYMEIFQNQNPNLSINEAFEQVRGLTKTQIFLSTLSPQQREEFHVGEHTERGIDFLQGQIRTLLIQAAFNLVQGLTAEQVDILIQLTPEQIQTLNFGPHTVIGIEFLQKQIPNLSLVDAFNKVQRLNPIEIQTLLTLSPEQIQGANFGSHTVAAIVLLQAKTPGLSLEDAFKQVGGLTRAQVFLLTLSPQQKQHLKIGEHTARGMDFLWEKISSLSAQAAFKLVNGLNEAQINVLVQLTPEQIQTPNFGSHTVAAIVFLQAKTPGLSLEDAFKQVGGLTRAQVFLSTLSPQQKEEFHVGEHTVRGMDFLWEKIPSLSGPAVFSLVQGLNEAQINVLVQLTLEHLKTPKFGSHIITAVAFLQTQIPGLSIANAFEKVQGLNPEEIKTLLTFTQEQVQDPSFGPDSVRTAYALQQSKKRKPDEAEASAAGEPPAKRVKLPDERQQAQNAAASAADEDKKGNKRKRKVSGVDPEEGAGSDDNTAPRSPLDGASTQGPAKRARHGSGRGGNDSE